MAESKIAERESFLSHYSWAFTLSTLIHLSCQDTYSRAVTFSRVALRLLGSVLPFPSSYLSFSHEHTLLRIGVSSDSVPLDIVFSGFGKDLPSFPRVSCSHCHYHQLLPLTTFQARGTLPTFGSTSSPSHHSVNFANRSHDEMVPLTTLQAQDTSPAFGSASSLRAKPKIEWLKLKEDLEATQATNPSKAAGRDLTRPPTASVS